MRRRFALLFAVTAVTALTLSGAGVAHAITPRTYARVIPLVQTSNGGTTGVLRAVYSCNQSDHLWVSVKQVNSGLKDPALMAEGSSAVADNYLQSHRNALTCDGRSHLGSFSVDTVEDGSKGALRPGWAWVQFCNLYQGTLTISEGLWVRVI
jgi:hypothetical protein